MSQYKTTHHQNGIKYTIKKVNYKTMFFLKWNHSLHFCGYNS